MLLLCRLSKGTRGIAKDASRGSHNCAVNDTTPVPHAVTRTSKNKKKRPNYELMNFFHIFLRVELKLDHLVNRFLAFYGTRRFVAAFTTARHSYVS